VTLVNAGHPSPLLYRSAGKTLDDAMPTEAAGVPLGILEQQEYPACQVRLGEGDSLLLFTDGVSDSFNVRGRAFSVKGILSALNDADAGSPQVAGARIVKALKHHSAGRSQHDDITLVCVGRTGG
jgi:serine phosphatase RsbU (regulator of sigma subunit)